MVVLAGERAVVRVVEQGEKGKLTEGVMDW